MLPDWYIAGFERLRSAVAAAVADVGFTSVVIQVFTGSGTYTPTAGMEYCIIEVQAPGGGGGGADANGTAVGSGAGGGGEYARGVFSAATVGASQTVTIGTAGAAGSNAGGNGGTGGTTSVGALITAIGGSGGTGTGSNSSVFGPRAGGVGGTGGTGGSFRVPGERGIAGYRVASHDGSADASGFVVGYGGNAVLGPGAKLATIPHFTGTTDQAGVTGGNYGGGGSGAADDDTTGSAGGTGGAGIIVITEFVS